MEISARVWQQKFNHIQQQKFNNQMQQPEKNLSNFYVCNLVTIF